MLPSELVLCLMMIAFGETLEAGMAVEEYHMQNARRSVLTGQAQIRSCRRPHKHIFKKSKFAGWRTYIHTFTVTMQISELFILVMLQHVTAKANDSNAPNRLLWKLGIGVQMISITSVSLKDSE